MGETKLPGSVNIYHQVPAADRLNESAYLKEMTSTTAYFVGVWLSFTIIYGPVRPQVHANSLMSVPVVPGMRGPERSVVIPTLLASGRGIDTIPDPCDVAAAREWVDAWNQGQKNRKRRIKEILSAPIDPDDTAHPALRLSVLRTDRRWAGAQIKS